MENYKELINNKRIIFVCPSNILIGKKMGTWIDSFDIVVRINQFFNTLNLNIEDCGQKCDVLYINNQFAREFSPFALKNWKQKGLKWLCWKHVLNEIDKKINNRSFGQVISELKMIDGILTGTIVVKDLLNQKPKELYISGMNFYSKVKNNNYYIDGYAPDRFVPDNLINNIDLNNQENKIHDIPSNKKYILRLYDRKIINFCDITKKELGLN